jgi:hypothetical protein
MSENALAQLNTGAIASRYQDDVFNDLTIQGGFLPRVNLYTSRSKLVQKELFKANHFGVVTGKDKITDLGETFHCVALAYRPMSLDLRDKKAVAYFDPNSAKFKECKEESLKKDSKCMAGIQFLLYIQNFGLATYYCASKSAKILAPQIRKLMNPLSFITFGSHTVESGEWVYRAPTVVLSNVQFDVPVQDILPKKEEFLNVGPVQVTDKDLEGDEIASTPAGGTEARPR